MLAIIGGTGIYHIDGIDIHYETTVETPFGEPSAPIIHAAYKDTPLLFLPRHGLHHQFLPHEVNYRANIFALKKCGATQVLGFSAMGSLRQEIEPGDLAIPTQYIDFIKGNREKTFFGEGLAAHVSTAEPTCRDLTEWVAGSAKEQGLTLHTDRTYVCVDGPRLGTRAESHYMRKIGGDLVGMTNVPEVFLAREAQLCYATIGLITDYDAWLDDPAHHVSVASVIERYGASLEKAHKLLLSLLETPVPEPDETYRKALTDAILTPPDAIPENKKELLEVLKA